MKDLWIINDDDRAVSEIFSASSNVRLKNDSAVEYRDCFRWFH